MLGCRVAGAVGRRRTAEVNRLGMEKWNGMSAASRHSRVGGKQISAVAGAVAAVVEGREKPPAARHSWDRAGGLAARVGARAFGQHHWKTAERIPD